jgi:hypothetical protein
MLRAFVCGALNFVPSLLTAEVFALTGAGRCKKATPATTAAAVRLAITRVRIISSCNEFAFCCMERRLVMAYYATVRWLTASIEREVGYTKVSRRFDQMSPE